MSNRSVIHTQNAPEAIGPYSQAIRVGNTVWLSGQIPLTPKMELITDTIEAQATQVFNNLAAVAEAANGTLKDIVKLNISLTDLNDFSAVNGVMETFFSEPYPARACVAVAALPKDVNIEVEAIMVI